MEVKCLKDVYKRHLLRGVLSFKVTVLIKDFGKGGITLSKKKATSSDVAKRAGVSQATVSMVPVSYTHLDVYKRQPQSQ